MKTAAELGKWLVGAAAFLLAVYWWYAELGGWPWH